MILGSAVSRFRVESNIQPLLDSSQFSISRNLTIAIAAASVLWLEALRRISVTISVDTCLANACTSQNFSVRSLAGLRPKTLQNRGNIL